MLSKKQVFEYGWYIEKTKENFVLLQLWFNAHGEPFDYQNFKKPQYKYLVHTGYIYQSKYSFAPSIQEITIKEFKKYILTQK